MSVHTVNNCDLGLENAALGLRCWAAFSRLRASVCHCTDVPVGKYDIYYPK